MLRPFFTYFGGKWRLAPKYPEPEHGMIVEPFAGSAGYSLRYPKNRVLLTDVDERVIGTWQYLIGASSDEISKLPIYDGSWHSVDDLHIPQEAKWLIGWWLNKGSAQPCKTPSAWMRKATVTGENLWGDGVKARIVRQQPYIRHWTAVLASYESLDNYAATWFVDPPYEIAGKSYRCNSVNYLDLAQFCRTREGLTIVAENDGATWLPFTPLSASKSTLGISLESVYVRRSS